MPGPRAHTCSPVCGFRRYPRMPGKQKLSAPPAGAGSDPALVPAQTSNSVGELCVSHVRGEVLQMLEFAFLLVRISGSHFRKDPTVSLASRWRRAEFRPSQSPKASRAAVEHTKLLNIE